MCSQHAVIRVTPTESCLTLFFGSRNGSIFAFWRICYLDVIPVNVQKQIKQAPPNVVFLDGKSNVTLRHRTLVKQSPIWYIKYLTSETSTWLLKSWWHMWKKPILPVGKTENFENKSDTSVVCLQGEIMLLLCKIVFSNCFFHESAVSI